MTPIVNKTRKFYRRKREERLHKDVVVAHGTIPDAKLLPTPGRPTPTGGM
jgi:hypothetical protein